MGYNLHRRSPLARAVSFSLAALMACTLTGSVAFADAASSNGIAPTLNDVSSILLFPPSNKAGSGFDSSSSKLGTSIKLKINGIGRYHAIEYTSTLSAVQRALDVDDDLTLADLTPPFDTASKGKKIAKVVGTDAYMLTSLDAETVDTQAGVVKVTASVLVYSVNAADPILESTVSGAAASAGAADPMSAVESRALDNAAGKIVSSLSPGFNSNRATDSIPTQGSGKKMGGSNLLILLLAGILVGVIANASHSGGSSSSSGSSTSTSSTSTGGTSTGGTTGPPAPPVVN